MSNEHPNFADFYAEWESLNKKPGATADMRRVSSMDELLDLPAFYRLVEPFGWHADLKSWDKERWQRLVFFVNQVTDKGENSLGKALALSGKISDKRLFQIVRADSPNDITQLRRLLKQAEPEVSWQKMATQLWYWDLRQKRSLLEDFVLNQKTKD
jgi:CRISPR system Cascade subunit CasB